MTQSNQPSYGTGPVNSGGTTGSSAGERRPGDLPGRDVPGPERRDLAPERPMSTGPDGPTRVEPDAARRDAEQVKDQARRARDEAKQTAEQGKQAARETAEQGKQMAKDVARQASQKTRELADRMREQGRGLVDQQRHRAADQLSTFGQAARDAARRLHEENDHNVADYVEAAADQVERAGQYLERRDLNGLLHDTQELARRRPEWIIGGMFIAGVALARFVKASSEHPHDMRTMPRYGSSPSSSPSYGTYSAGAMTGEAGTAGMAAPAGATGASPLPPDHGLPTPGTSTVAPDAARNDPVAFPGTASSVTGPASVSAGPSSPPTAAGPGSTPGTPPAPEQSPFVVPPTQQQPQHQTPSPSRQSDLTRED